VDASAHSDRAASKPVQIIRPLPDNLVRDVAIGAGGGVLLANVIPYLVPQLFQAVSGSISGLLVTVGLEIVLLGAAITLLLRRCNTVRFEPARLVITRLLWPRQHIYWSQVISAGLVDVGDNERDCVAHRKLVLGMRTIPESRSGQLRHGVFDRIRWRKAIYRDVTLPVRFPRSDVDESPDASDPNSRAQQALRRELASRQIWLRD